MGDANPNTFLTLVRGREGRRRESNGCVSLSRTSRFSLHVTTCLPQLMCPLKSIDIAECGLHPKREGHLGVEEPKNVHIGYSKTVNEWLTL